MPDTIAPKPVDILLVEDNPADVRLMVEALKDSRIKSSLRVAWDGVEALKFLRAEPPYQDARRPHLVLLDLNLPRKDGREVLAEIKMDLALKSIPVVIFTTSSAEKDVEQAYNLHANCYITKPLNLDMFTKVVWAIEDFWLSIVQLPLHAT